MELLILQFVDPRRSDPQPVFSHSLGVLASLLAEEDIPCSLLALPGYRPDLIHRAIIQRRPRYVLADLTPYSVTAAHRSIVDIAERFQLPVAACGSYATCRPAEAISLPGAEVLLLGEYEEAAVAVLQAWRDGADPAGLPGTWVRSDGGLVKAELPPLREDLDALPFPARELFGFAELVRATGEAGFKVARGCPYWCGYCVNDWYMDLYEDRGPFVRRRSVGNVLAEILGVVGRYNGIRSIRFYDHCFATDTDWLKAFAADYPRRCVLPYDCHVRLRSVTERVAALLAASGCRRVFTQIGSGSRFIRDEILGVYIGDEEVLDACSALKEAGLEISAEVFVGSPYESEITVEETLELVRRADVDEVRPRVFYPVPGTRAAELCHENGWIGAAGEEHFWSSRSVLDMPSMPAAHIDAVAEKFHTLLKRPRSSSLRRLLGKVRRTRRKNVMGLGGQGRR